MQPCPPLVGRHTLGALAVIGHCADTYIINDLSRKSWKNYWIVDDAQIIRWRQNDLNIKLSAHGHKYRIITVDGRTIVRHIVPKKVIVPNLLVRFWNWIRSL